MKKLFFFLAVSLGLLATSMQAQTVGTEDRMIALTQNGETTLLAPNGADESYFWTSISPDGTKILYVTARHGAFVCNLDGTEVRSLGYMNAPVWANDQWVVGMQDIDDGEDVISSTIIARTIDGVQTKEIRTREKIAMYPKMLADGKVSYQNLEGETFTAKVKLPAVELTATNLVPNVKCVRRAPQQKANTTGSLSGLKIYVNPGHGGYDANDRSCWTIPVPKTWSDPNGYWESKSNLVKGLHLRDMLEAAGAEVIMSRVTNNSGERDLEYYPNAGAAEKEALMKGDDRPLSAIAEEANANNVDHFISIHTNALNGKTNYLLILYHGETGKPKVADSDKMAASTAPIQIKNQLTVWNASAPKIYGDWTFYGDDATSSAPGLGVLRPLTVPGFLSEGSFHDYAPETHRLMNSDYCKIEAIRFFQHFHKYYSRELPQTGTIAGWVKSANEKVDVLGEKNFYYFPGTDDQWLPLNGVVVYLLDRTGQTVLQTYTTDDWYNGVFAFYDVAPGDYKLAVKKDKYAMDTVDVKVAAEEIAQAKIRVNNIRMAAEDYPRPDQDAGTVAPDEFEFEAGNKVAFAGKNILRAIHRDNQLVVLTADNAITTYTTAGTNKATVAVPAGATLSDIAFSADGYLMALAVAGNEATIYTWDALTGQARVLFTQTVASVGKTLAVSGARWEAKVYLTADKQLVGIQYNEDAPAALAVKALALDKDLTDAQLTIMPSGELYLDSKTLPAMACTFDWNGTAVTTKELLTPDSQYQPQAITIGSTFFRYGDGVLMTELLSDETGANVGFRIVDITTGFEVGKHVSTKYPEAGLGATAAPYMTAMAVVEGYDVTVYLLAENQGLQTFKTVATPIANIYAGEVSFTEEAGFTFRLNEDATSVSITIEEDGNIVDTYEAGALTKGVHAIANPFGGKGFDAFNITASARAVAYPVKISNDDTQFQLYAPRGVAVDKTPTSPFFGRVYTTNGAAGTDGFSAFTSKQTIGVFVLSSDLKDVTGQAENGYRGEVEWGANVGGSYQHSLACPTVGPDGKVYVTSSALTSTGVYIMDPANPSAAFTPVFQGRRNTETGAVRGSNGAIHNMVMHAAVLGTGADAKLYIYDRDISVGTVSTGIKQFNIGEVETLPWTTKPSAVTFDDAMTGVHMQNGCGQMHYDSHGGWWVSQYRYSSTEAIPSLMHVTNGVIDYNCGSSIPTSVKGGMAVNVDGSRLAIGTEGGMVKVYDVEYNAANVPTLTEVYTIQWASEGNTSFIDFDAAGNLYIVSNSNERLMIYSLPKADNSYTTRIPYLREGTALEGVNAENAVKVRKVVENGQVYIIKDNVKYNVLGTVVR